MTAAELQTARAALGLTQGALASALGVDRRTIQYWEGGDRSIPETIARLIRLALVDAALLDRLAAA